MNILDVARGGLRRHWSVADGYVSIEEPTNTKRIQTKAIKALKFPFLGQCVIWTFEGERSEVSLELFRLDEIESLRIALKRWKNENTKKI